MVIVMKRKIMNKLLDWKNDANPMKKTGPIGVWEVFVPDVVVGDLYKFYIKAQDGREMFKADVYGGGQ